MFQCICECEKWISWYPSRCIHQVLVTHTGRSRPSPAYSAVCLYLYCSLVHSQLGFVDDVNIQDGPEKYSLPSICYNYIKYCLSDKLGSTFAIQ